MAQYEFFGYIGVRGSKHYEIVDVPDDELVGLNESEKERVLIKHHTKWLNRHSYGGWELIFPEASDSTESA